MAGGGISGERQDVTWWEQRSSHEIAHLLRHHEGIPLVPQGASQPSSAPKLTILDSVPDLDRYQSAVPVYDLAVAAGAFSSEQSPEPLGWARVHATRQLDKSMFVARIMGRSMEQAIPDGSMGLFRMYSAGAAPSSLALDGRRVVVQMRDDMDPETGGRYTLKRWRVTRHTADGGVQEVELRPDNPDHKPRRFTPKDGDIRVIAEFLEVVG